MPEPVEGTEVPDDQVRCPHCQTTRLKVLKKLDRIEKLYGNALMNRMRARRGDTIYHCVYCRLQFYDPRKPGAAPAPPGSSRDETAPEKSEPEPAAIPVAPPLPAPVVLEPKAASVNGTPAAAPAAGTNLAAGVRIRGSIQSDEDIFVDGRIDGSLVLKEHRLTLGKNAIVKAGVRAGEVEVRGTLHGNSQAARKMVLRAGSNVVGDIKAGDIVIEDGAHFKGSVELVREQPRLPLG